MNLAHRGEYVVDPGYIQAPDRKSGVNVRGRRDHSHLWKVEILK